MTSVQRTTCPPVARNYHPLYQCGLTEEFVKNLIDNHSKMSFSRVHQQETDCCIGLKLD